MAPSTVRQLAPADAAFLSVETREAGGHVGALMILDPPSAGFSHEKLRDHIAERIALVPRFGWKLDGPALGLDQPYWVEDEDFDPFQHITRTAVPAPGSPELVNALVTRLHAQPVDRSRPLWEVWIIEGVANGKLGLYMKTHHALVDGTGGSGLAEILADVTPNPEGAPYVPEAFREEAPKAPSTLDRFSHALRNGRERRQRFGHHVGRALRSAVAGAFSEEEPAPEVARLSFNGSIGARRTLATASLELERVRDLKKHFDVKVNDVVLEIVGSAMRRWLRDRGENVEKPLVAMCPVSTRGEEKGMGNEITSMAVPLATDVVDPVARLKAIHASATKAKEAAHAGTHLDLLTAVFESLPPAGVQLVMKASGAAAESAPLPANFVVSNVRGAPVPLYLGGARVESMMPLSMLSVGQGLNVTLISYCDRVDIGIIADPELVPDVKDLADRFPAALAELEAAAEGVVYRAR